MTNVTRNQVWERGMWVLLAVFGALGLFAAMGWHLGIEALAELRGLGVMVRELALLVLLAACGPVGWCPEPPPEDVRHCAVARYPYECMRILGYHRQELPCQ